MKRSLLILLTLFSLLPLTACRRRIMPDAEQIVYETYRQELPVTEPTEAPTTEPPEPTEPPEQHSEQPTQPSASETAQTPPPTVPAENGATVPSTEPTEPMEITVTLDANRGSCSVQELRVSVGAPYGRLPVAERSGFTFTGWFDSRNGGTRIDETTLVTVSQAHTLYAHWAARAGYAVIFDPNGGRLPSEESERLVYAGDAYGELPAPTRRGYDFAGWYTEKENGSAVQATDLFSETGTQTLYAHWDYNPFDYWSFFLENTTQQVYSCQQKSVYVEYDADGVTASYCSLLSAVGSYSVAQNREDMNVTDDWVLEKNPNVIVKIVSDFGTASGAYASMAARFPGAWILVVPGEAIYGSEAQQLYYRICFGKLLYPEWYTEAQPEVVGAELGVGGSIYG